MVKVIQFIFISLIACINLQAQPDNTYLLFKSYSTKEGLSSYYSRKIAEDKFGFIWIATQDGLNRFDGKRFIQFNKNTEQRIAGNDVTDIAIDDQNNLVWVSTALGGINAIDTRTLKVKKEFLVKNPVTAEMNDWILSMLLVKNELWIGTNKGLFIYDTKQNKITRQAGLPDSFKESKAARINKLILRNETSIIALVNNTMIAEYNAGEKKILSVTCCPDQSQRINDICLFRTNTILAATSSGLISFDIKISGTERKIIAAKNNIFPFIPAQYTRCINIRGDSTVLLATAEGLFQAGVNSKWLTRIKNSSEPEGLAFAWEGFINQLYFDSNNNLWMSTTHGTMVSNGLSSPFTAYTNLNKGTLKISHPFSICNGINGEYLVNTNNGLIICDQSFTTGSKLYPDISFYSGIIVKNSTLLLTSKGIKRIYNNRLGSPSVIFPELRTIESEQIGPWIQTGDSAILLAGYNGQGIWKWNYLKGSVELITTGKDVSLYTQQVNSFYQDSSKSILITCVSNIYRYTIATGSLSEISLRNTPKDAIYYDITRKKGFYFIGTYGDGILVYDTSFNLVKQIKKTDGLPNNNIYNFYDLGSNKIMAATNFGVSVINTDDYSLRSYFENDGLASNNFEYNFHINSPNSRIFLPSINGLTMVSPGYFTRNSVHPKIYFERISIKTNSSLKDTIDADIKKIVIPDNFLQVSIFFTGLDYINPGRLQYFYRIPRVASHWINNEGKDFISLISMTPGTYNLQVKAVNEDGVESEIKELTLVFLPRWYQTWWFKTLVVLIILVCGYLLYRMRINQFKKEKQIRNKLASDLHDDLGSTMNSVKVYANLAIMEKQQEKYLFKIKESTQEAITGIRDIIWVLDDSKDSIDHLLSRISLFASPLCEAKGILYKQEISDEARDHKLGQEERRNLYMILKEAVNNAVKYSGGKKIEIEVSVKKGRPAIQIKDDGKGFNTQVAGDGNGLKNMNRRAKEIKYHILIDSAPGSGTAISFQKI